MSWLAKLVGRTPRAAEGDPERVRAAEAVIARLAPLVALDGGSIELEAVEGDEVVVRLRGACSSCASQSDTLARAIEPALRGELAWCTGVRRI